MKRSKPEKEELVNQVKWGFPMDWKKYEYGRPLNEGTHDGIVLGVFSKDNEGQPLKTAKGDDKRRVVVGFEGPEGRLQIDFHAAAGFYDNFVENVLPEEWEKLRALADGEEYDVPDWKARGRLVRCVTINEEYEGKIRPKIKRFVEPDAQKLAAGPGSGSSDAQEPVTAGVEANPFDEGTPAADGGENPFSF